VGVTSEVQEKLFQKRVKKLKEIVGSTAPVRNKPLLERVRHEIQDRMHSGEFVLAVCDHCFTELYRPEQSGSEVVCPGCGDKSSFPCSAATARLTRQKA